MSIPDKLLAMTLDATQRCGGPRDGYDERKPPERGAKLTIIASARGIRPFTVRRGQLAIGRFASLFAAIEAYPEATVTRSAEKAARAAGSDNGRHARRRR